MRYALHHLNIPYYTKHFTKIRKYVSRNYNLVGVDPGTQNLLAFRDIENGEIDCFNNKWNRKLKVKDPRLKNLREDIFDTFGEKSVLCIGDGGCNKINFNMVEYLNKHFPIYMVNEFRTSQYCHLCQHPVNLQKKSSHLKNFVICSNDECRNICDKDGNAAKNILNKVLDNIDDS